MNNNIIEKNEKFMMALENIINDDIISRCQSQDVAIPYTTIDTIDNEKMMELFRNYNLNDDISIAYEMNPPERIYFSYKEKSIPIIDSSNILNILSECIKQDTNEPLFENIKGDDIQELDDNELDIKSILNKLDSFDKHMDEKFDQLNKSISIKFDDISHKVDVVNYKLEHINDRMNKY